MNDPHTLRHPRPATIHHLLDRLPGSQREESTPPARAPGTPHTPAAAAESFSPTPLTPQQKEVLQAVADQRIHRDVLLGTLEPHLLSGHDVIWTLRALVIRDWCNSNPSDRHVSPPADAAESIRTERRRSPPNRLPPRFSVSDCGH